MTAAEHESRSIASNDAARNTLELKGAAAVRAFEAINELHKRGSNLIFEALRSGGEFTEWNHYPPDDVRDPVTGAQYYFHAHAAGDREDSDFGHFHTFLRANSVIDDPSDDLCHLVAISMGPNGMPEKLFTTNRWVTDEKWIDAPTIVRSLPRFEIKLDTPSLELNGWMNAMFVLFSDEIKELLLERDRVIDFHRRQNPDIDVFEDRKLDVLAELRISLPEKFERLQQEASAAV